mgnify:CR=1 FL=1
MAKAKQMKATKRKRKNDILLGAIADDIAGATDLCDILVGQGMRTVLEIGVPRKGQTVRDADAVVIALPTRTGPAKAAVRQSLAALRMLQARGAISVAERAQYIKRIRDLACLCADAWLGLDEEISA